MKYPEKCECPKPFCFPKEIRFVCCEPVVTWRCHEKVVKIKEHDHCDCPKCRHEKGYEEFDDMWEE